MKERFSPLAEIGWANLPPSSLFWLLNYITSQKQADETGPVNIRYLSPRGKLLVPNVRSWGVGVVAGNRIGQLWFPSLVTIKELPACLGRELWVSPGAESFLPAMNTGVQYLWCLWHLYYLGLWDKGLDKEDTLCSNGFGCLEKIREDCIQYDCRRVPIRI